ncbi:hypothetical protein RFI_25151 [Reticulomyxa filosa]|uniref:Uncharacterized protein n=1 Tax=Reticulomyxa filosa TaxID=46433 RepID=X6ME90_RETFI|nr:hypothetical protein RFI_25151 [Reticulomyxa filosa]|eukprot:ETO12224.1 hypothetical protein RFI_25151 [Reticulomyxa filosa]
MLKHSNHFMFSMEIKVLVGVLITTIIKHCCGLDQVIKQFVCEIFDHVNKFKNSMDTLIIQNISIIKTFTKGGMEEQIIQNLEIIALIFQLSIVSIIFWQLRQIIANSIPHNQRWKSLNQNSKKKTNYTITDIKESKRDQQTIRFTLYNSLKISRNNLRQFGV